MLSLFFSIWLSAAVPSIGWFYASSFPLSYPGAYSYMLDGPYQTKLDCEMAREDAVRLAQTFGVTLEAQLCHERKSA